MLERETDGNADGNLAVIDSEHNEAGNADRRRLARVPP
jgi:hypothetical protein